MNSGVITRGLALTLLTVQALTPIVTKKAAIAALAADIDARRAEANGIAQDQSRVRENLNSLKATSEEQQLVKRYTALLTHQEDRLEVLHRELADLERKRQQAEGELTQMIEALMLDIDLARP